MLVYQTYEISPPVEDTDPAVVLEQVEEVELAYDNGRLYIYINGDLIYTKLDAGTDFRVTISKDKKDD